MSGICGWLETGCAAIENRAVIERMTRPLACFDNSHVQTIVKNDCAISIAAAPHLAHIYEADDLLVAIYGDVKFRQVSAQPDIPADNVAAIFASQWRRRGKAVFAMLAGEFVCCVFDRNTGELNLAVDPMGTRPLYYQRIKNGILFATRADSVLGHPQAIADINPQGIFNYFYFHMIPAPDSIYLAQKKLLPGELLTFTRDQVQCDRYTQIQFDETGERPFSELKQEFLALLKTSVSEATRNQQVGAFLSGGTDSSTLAGILTEVTGKPAKTYSIGFEAEGYDEMSYARIAARHFSTDHHEYYVTPDDVVAAIPGIAAVFDQPFGNASAIPAYYCARMAKQDGLDRLLGGDGGDEFFGGNTRYAKQYVFSLYDRIPAWLRDQVIAPLVLSLPSESGPVLTRKMRSYIAQATVPMPHRMETYNLLVRYGINTVFSDEFLAQIQPDYPAVLLEQTYNESRASSLINRMLAHDWKFTLADNDLPKVVQACQLAGMEAAFPFLNHEMVAFSAKLPPQLKLKGTQLRYFFKKALRDFLPDEIIAKPKQGFGLPFGVWLKNDKGLKEIAADSLHDLKSRHIIRDEFIDTLLDQHLHEHAGYHGTMVWLLMMMEYWNKQRITVKNT
ncbi:MAG: asparagine synthase C-terminal domain-containing protein [Nitrosomonas sp.]|nr:asparagine synthase C-terminal domain-containing protein [Nitrosomonas sp.]